MRILKVAFASAWGILLAAVLVWIQFNHLEGAAMTGGAFRFHLTDQSGRAVSEADFRGRPMLVYFGYTFCPDVCPTTLSMVADALQALGTRADNVIPILITIDPERDTAPVLRDYLMAFGPRFVGLTGAPKDISAAAHQLGVFYSRAGDGPDYTMDHSANLYVLGPDGQRRAAILHGASARELEAAIREYALTNE